MADIPMTAVNKGRQTIWHLQKMKEKGELISMVGTAYLDPMFTMMAEKAGINLVRYTAPGENSEMRAQNIKWWTRLQRKMAPNICLNAVMQAQQHCDPITAVREGAVLMADGADAVMPMGVTLETLNYMVKNEVQVIGHVGCLSGFQTARFGGYRRVGKTAEDALKIFRQAHDYQENGMAAMTIEMTPREVTDLVAKKLRVPVIEVAAGGVADGSEMVIFDLLGFLPDSMMAKHSKAYAATMNNTIKGYMDFDKEVKEKIYPAEENGWGMDPAEYDKFLTAVEREY